MSAHKTAIVRLGEKEYQRLREAEEKLRLIELAGRQSESNNVKDSIYDQMLAEREARDLQYNEIIRGLAEKYDNFADKEDETAHWIESQNDYLQKRLIQSEKDAVNWADQVSAELDQRQKFLEQKNLERDRQFDIQKIIEEEDARCWIISANQLLEHLQTDYSLDLDSANEIEIQRDQIEEANRQFNAGRDHRAWSVARSAWDGLSRLRHYLEGQRAAIAACKDELLSTARKVVDRIQDCQVVQAMDADGNELTEQIDVAYWTEGAYTRLVDQALQARAAVQGITEVDLNELIEWREEFRLLDERAIDLITEARLAVLASQLRFNVAQIVVRALETQGFYLEEAAYSQNDYRCAFMARTRSMSGSEVLVTIDPDPLLDEGGRVNIRSDDAQLVTEHELLQRNREIFQAIRQQGLEVGESKKSFSDPQSVTAVESHLRQLNKKRT